MSKTRVSVLDVAAYILESAGSMTTMKLQKLVYYSQAWHLAWTSKPLFDDPIEAWANGPVTPALFAKHRRRYSIDRMADGDPSRLSKADKRVVEKVLRAYGPLEASQIGALTHAETPWIKARYRAANSADPRISNAAMRKYYRKLGKRGKRVEEIDWSAWYGASVPSTRPT